MPSISAGGYIRERQHCRQRVEKRSGILRCAQNDNEHLEPHAPLADSLSERRKEGKSEPK
jgi:hypothetical protein